MGREEGFVSLVFRHMLALVLAVLALIGAVTVVLVLGASRRPPRRREGLAAMLRAAEAAARRAETGQATVHFGVGTPLDVMEQLQSILSRQATAAQEEGAAGGQSDTPVGGLEPEPVREQARRSRRMGGEAS